MDNGYFVRVLPNYTLDYTKIFKTEQEVEEYKKLHPEMGNFEITKINGSE